MSTSTAWSEIRALTASSAEIMQLSDADRYRGMMVEVKGRTRLIQTLGGASPPRIPLPALVEFCYLHLRKILELVAMGSLLANAQAFGNAHDELKKYWNAKDLLRDIKKLNPDFYPKPIIQTPSKVPGVTSEWTNRKDDFLTTDRFITLYDVCGGVLHSQNPFRAEPDYPTLSANVQKWLTWIVNLLNAHTIKLKGDSKLYLFQMCPEDQMPSYHVFSPK